MAIPDVGNHDSAAFHSNFESLQGLCDLAQGIVRTVEAIQPARVILFVEAFGTQEQMKVAKRAMDLDRFMIRARRERGG